MSSQSRSANDAHYELIYWPGLPGRGELIRLLFEEAGVPYTDTAKGTGDDAVSAVLGYISTGNKGDANNPPVLAPPILRHGGLTLHQTPNILLYLAPRLGLAPAPGDDGLLHLNQIVLTIIDGLVNEVHETHHPIAVSAVYEDQKPEATKRSKVFRDERLPKYLAYVQRLLDAETSGQGPWLYGDKLTYADLVLFQVSVTSSTSPCCSRLTKNRLSMAPCLPFPRPWTSSSSLASTPASLASTTQLSSGLRSRSTWRATDGFPTRTASGAAIQS